MVELMKPWFTVKAPETVRLFPFVVPSALVTIKPLPDRFRPGAAEPEFPMPSVNAELFPNDGPLMMALFTPTSHTVKSAN